MFNLTQPLQPNAVRTDQFFFGSIFASAAVPVTKKSSPDAHNIVKVTPIVVTVTHSRGTLGMEHRAITS